MKNPSAKKPSENPAPLPLIDSETKALLKLGFIVPADIALFAFLLMGGFGSVIWIIAARPDLVYVLLAMAVAQLVLTIWTLTLVYRTSYFVLMMRAVMETMPEHAASIAMSMFAAKTATPPAVEEAAPLEEEE